MNKNPAVTHSAAKELAMFLFCSTVYRLFSGALLVSLTWTILNQNEGGYWPLALAIFCSFIPAFITPSIIKRLAIRMNGRQMSSWFVFGLTALALVSGVSRDFTAGLLITNLFVWLMIMSLEASLDMWFTQLQRGMDETRVRRISGATTATSQAALMIGPLLAAGLMPIQPADGGDRNRPGRRTGQTAADAVYSDGPDLADPRRIQLHAAGVCVEPWLGAV
jgi:MFS family permease